MKDFKDIFRIRGFIIWILFLIFYLIILAAILKIQFNERSIWEKVINNAIVKKKSIKPDRGDIYDINNKLLATTVPYYNIRFDCKAKCLDTKKCKHKKGEKCNCPTAFDKDLNAFCKSFAKIFPDVKEKDIKNKIINGRKTHKRSLLLKAKVNRFQADTLKSLNNRLSAAIVSEEIKQREYLYGILGKRTIGKSSGKVGIEGGYDSILRGIEGFQPVQLLRDRNLIPVDGWSDTKPEDGYDLITTIDIELQDIVTSSLEEGLKKSDAEFGTAILMDVKTGEIRACANLTKTEDGKYLESLNNAVYYSYQPGSTFKTVSMLAVLNDFDPDLKDSVMVNDNNWKLFGKPISDATKPKKNYYTMYDIMDNSSNIGISKVVHRYYKNDPQKFIDRLKQMGIFDSIKIDIPGSGISKITLEKHITQQKEAIKSYSYGYQIKVTPIHLATFYNAIANNGKMVKPHFVSKIKYKGSTIENIETEVIVKSISDRSSLSKIRELLEHVGNSKKRLFPNNENHVSIKTGTTRITDNTGTIVGYDASVAGYFPSEDPKYTCVILVHKPKIGYYGGDIAAPILKKISDNVSLMNRKGIKPKYEEQFSHLPLLSAGFRKDLQKVYEILNYNTDIENKSDWAIVNPNDKQGVTFNVYDNKNGIVPNVTGMSAKDAVYILENKGLRVRTSGIGKVKKQSIPSGYTLIKGNEIILTLSLN